MLDFVVATGSAGVIGIAIVFVVVFALAEPGKEISFWGIKFHKKHLFKNLSKWRPLPRKAPADWVIVLEAFTDLDEHHISEASLFAETRRIGDFSELQTRAVVAQMKKYGLIRQTLDYVVLTEKALRLSEYYKNNNGYRESNG